MRERRKRAKRLSHIGKGVSSVKDVTVHFCCEALTELNLHSNCIESFEGVEGLQSLRALNLSANRLPSLKGFPFLPSLETLNLASNGLVSCEGLPFLSTLKSLTLTHNRIRDLSVLEGYRNGQLARLDVRGNPLDVGHSLVALRKITTLTDLRYDKETVHVHKLVGAAAKEHLTPSLPEFGTQMQLSVTEEKGMTPSPNSARLSNSLQVCIDKNSAESCPQWRKTRDDSALTAVGHPMSFPAMANHQSLVAAPVINKVDRGTCMEVPFPQVQMTDAATSTVSEDWKTEVKTVSVQVDIPSQELLDLRQKKAELTDRTSQLEDELLEKKEKQRSIEAEFLQKIKAAKESSVEELRRQADQATVAAKKERELYDKEVLRLDKKLKESSQTVTSLKELTKRIHADLQQQREANLKLKEDQKEDRRKFAETLKAHEDKAAQQKQAHESQIADQATRLSDAQNALQEKESALASLKASLVETSEELAAARKQADEQSRESDRKVGLLEEELAEAKSRVHTLSESKASLESDIKEAEKRFVALEEKHRRDVSELESLFEQRLSRETATAFDEGKAKGKELIDEKLAAETHRLKQSFTSVESKFKEAQKECETRNEDLKRQLRDKEEAVKELTAALEYGMQRSQQQNCALKEMHTIIQRQQLAIRALKDELCSLKKQIDQSSIERLQMLEKEVEFLIKPAEEAKELKTLTAELKKSLSDKEEELKLLKADDEKKLANAQRDLENAQSEMYRLRSKIKGLHEISEHLHQDRQSFADAVKVKEAMLESANATVKDLKEGNEDFRNENARLKECLDEAEAEVEKLQREAEDAERNLSEESMRRLDKLEKALSQEKETVNILRRKLDEKRAEYDEKTKVISVVEAEVVKCKAKYDERVKRAESEKEDALQQLREIRQKEQDLHVSECQLRENLVQLQTTFQVETAHRQRLHDVGLKLKRENKELKERAMEVESDMKRLLLSLDRERGQSADKIRQLERILSELRTPLLQYK